MNLLGLFLKANFDKDRVKEHEDLGTTINKQPLKVVTGGPRDRPSASLIILHRLAPGTARVLLPTPKHIQVLLVSKVEEVKLLTLNDSGTVSAAESSDFISALCKTSKWFIINYAAFMQICFKLTPPRPHLHMPQLSPGFQWLVFKPRPLTCFPSMRWASSEGKEIISASKIIVLMECILLSYLLDSNAGSLF